MLPTREAGHSRLPKSLPADGNVHGEVLFRVAVALLFCCLHLVASQYPSSRERRHR